MPTSSTSADQQRESSAVALATASARLRRTGGAAFLGLLLLLGGLVAVEIGLSQRMDGDARTVNVAGRQRMLSQRIAVMALRTVDGEPGAPAELRATTELLLASHGALVAGDGREGVRRPLTPALRDHLLGPGGVEEQLRDLDGLVATVLDDPGGDAGIAAAATTVDLTTGPLLAALDRAVGLEEARSEASLRGERLLQVLVLVLGVGGAVLLARRLLLPLLRIADDAARRIMQLDDEVTRRSRWQQDFATIASHELRTPITVVTGIAGIIASGWDRLTTDARADLVERMQGAAAALHDLLEELSLVAGLGTPGDRTRTWPVTELLAEWEAAPGVRVRCAERLWVDADLLRTRLLVRELVDNGLRHGEGLVELRVATVGRSLVVEVADEGPGLAPAQVDHLLQPFGVAGDVQHHSSETGRGLGLAMARRVVEDARGSMQWVPGLLGGRWRVELPDVVVQPRASTSPVVDASVAA